jgi:hypothetical protein
VATAEVLCVLGDFGGETGHFGAVLLGAQEFALDLVQARAEGKAFTFGEQCAGLVRGADRDTFEPGAAQGCGVGQRDGRYGDSEECQGKEARQHERTLG